MCMGRGEGGAFQENLECGWGMGGRGHKNSPYPLYTFKWISSYLLVKVILKEDKFKKKSMLIKIESKINLIKTYGKHVHYRKLALEVAENDLVLGLKDLSSLFSTLYTNQFHLLLFWNLFWSIGTQHPRPATSTPTGNIKHHNTFDRRKLYKTSIQFKLGCKT